MDSISELPDTILHGILCLLPQKQAIQTSALSKSWRHVGSTRPKLEFRDTDFHTTRRRQLLHILYTTLQRYDRQNLPLQEVILEMEQTNKSKSTSVSLIIQMVLTNKTVKKFHLKVPNYAVSPRVIFRAEFLTELHLNGIHITTDSYELFPIKNLKTISLDQVRIHQATLENLIRSCPLIERLILSRRVGDSPLVVPCLIFQAEFLSELRLSWCKLNFNHDTLFLIKRLKTLSLELVDIGDQTLEKIIRSSPLIECIHVSNRCDRLIKTIKLNNWYGHNNCRPFLHVKSLHLERVKLPAESFYSFSSDFPALQDLELKCCFGFKDIQLTLCSIKRLVIITDSDHMINEATIYAPNIRYFELSVHTPPRLTFYTEDACREWKSRVTVVQFCVISKDSVLPWLLQLNRLLNALSESQISLDVSVLPLMNLTVEGTNDAGFYKHVAVENVNLTRVEHCQQPTSFHTFLNCLFLLCRPRCISLSWRHTKNKLAEYMIHKVIRKEGEMSSGYFWDRYLVESSMEVWDDDFKEWLEPSFLESSPSDLKIRFKLKWKD